MNMTSTKNHPFVVWAICVMWLISTLSVTWALMLFFCLGDMLILSHLQLVNALILLSGLMMIPTNVQMLCTIANGERVVGTSKVLCCPLWLCIVWIIIINCAGVVICILRLFQCKETILDSIKLSMGNYRNASRYKHFIDNLQWGLQCCGITSYKDWFKHDWSDKVRDYEWRPQSKHHRNLKKLGPVTDSVPLSCCKSGSCVSNFLMELGTHSINTRGCVEPLYRIIITSMYIYLVVFSLVVIVEIFVLKYITDKCDDNKSRNGFVVQHLMPVNTNFEMSSASSSLDLEDCDDLEPKP